MGFASFRSREAIRRLPSALLINSNAPEKIGSVISALVQNQHQATSTALFLATGTKGAIAHVVLKDFSTDALGWFQSVRTPAALVGVVAFDALFMLQKKKSKSNQTEQILVNIYNITTMVSLILSIIAVFFSTQAGSLISKGEFNPMAQTAYEMMRREFEYEFICTRWSFLSSAVCFIVSVLTSAASKFDLFRRENRNSALAMGFLFGALLCNLFGYINSTLVGFPNLVAMGFYVLKVSYERIVESKSISLSLSLCSILLSACFSLKMAVNKRENRKEIRTADNL